MFQYHLGFLLVLAYLTMTVDCHLSCITKGNIMCLPAYSRSLVVTVKYQEMFEDSKGVIRGRKSKREKHWPKEQGQEKCEDFKWIIRSRKSKDRKYNRQRKKNNLLSNDLYLQNTTKKTKDLSSQIHAKTGAKPTLWACKQFLLHMWHLLWYSSYKPSDKSWMKTSIDCDKTKLTISMSICHTDIP